jgi:hypothetical protein
MLPNLDRPLIDFGPNPKPLRTTVVASIVSSELETRHQLLNQVNPIHLPIDSFVITIEIDFNGYLCAYFSITLFFFALTRQTLKVPKPFVSVSNRNFLIYSCK